MATAIGHGPGAVVLERDARPGGLVRTEPVDGFWFDRVLHLLYFHEAGAEAELSGLLDGLHLGPCPPDAWVVTDQGTARFPIQLHLGDLEPDAAVACILGLHDARRSEPPAHLGELLEASFGRTLCDLFFAPYNRKQWGVPLQRIATDRFLWNLQRPPLAEVLRGAIAPDRRQPGYNHHGVYPRPPADAPWRGMEVLSREMARVVPDLRTSHEVMAVDLDERRVRVRSNGHEADWGWSEALVSTAPLPWLLDACQGVPADLLARGRGLPWNGVSTVGIRVRGPRPELGTWRYYPDPDLVFTRLVFLHAFDPRLAPDHGWPLMAEVTWRGEEGPPDARTLTDRVIADARRAGVLTNCEVEGAEIWVTAPAYVRFEHGVADTIDEALDWLRVRGVEAVGRYGRWEYSSMQQVLIDGLAVGRALRSGA